MPDMSPRRSSRAHTSQPSSAAHNSSTSSSTSSVKNERVSRPLARKNSNVASNSPSNNPLSPSQSSGDDESHDIAARQTRQKKQLPDSQPPKLASDGEDHIEDEDGEEEVTRCLCTQSDYPGPPTMASDPIRPTSAREKRSSIQLNSSEPLAEESGIFIQCDICSVWQHGGCVGIMSEEASPENYYCERCRADLHKVMIDSKGRQYSHYLPVVDAGKAKLTRKTSLTRDDVSRSSKEVEIKPEMSAKMAAAIANKRRSTMNSRAAAQEDYELQKALEASKGANGEDVPNSVTRASKRGRDDSPENNSSLKRRKTRSDSDERSNMPLETEEASDEAGAELRDRSSDPTKKSRIPSAPAPPEKEGNRRNKGKEKERDRGRVEAAGRRKERAGRRRADESEIPEEPTKHISTTKTSNTKNSRTQTNGKSALDNPAQAPVNAQRKSARQPARRGKVGNNQYTKEREAASDGRPQPTRESNSRDSEDAMNGGETANHGSSNGSKPSKPRQMNIHRHGINEFRRRAAAILEYISRTQVELAGDSTPPQTNTRFNSKSRRPNPRKLVANGASKLSNEIREEEEAAAAAAAGALAETEDKMVETKKEKEGSKKVEIGTFKAMSSLEMMDVLTREIVLWQKLHGKIGEK